MPKANVWWRDVVGDKIASGWGGVFTLKERLVGALFVAVLRDNR